MTHTHDGGASFVSSILIGLAVAIPEQWMSYGGKVVSVFLLACAAELGRRVSRKIVDHFGKK